MTPSSRKGEYLVAEQIADTSFGGPHVVIVGAGASRAAFPDGDRNGKRLPLMTDLVATLGLESLLENNGIAYTGRNFEEIFGELHEGGNHSDLLAKLEEEIWIYFDSLQLPDEPTLYDHLVCSLRAKDLIVTFNWDPFLIQATERNHKQLSMPNLGFLHGNVAVGHCLKDKTIGHPRRQCGSCGEPYEKSQLLYPIKKKDYNSDEFTKQQWNEFQRYLRSAFILTIFGYSAPTTDVEAMDKIKEGWGKGEEKKLEEIEIIDIKDEGVLKPTWAPLIHSHHFRTETDFYDSILSRHPRRSCESMWQQIMMAIDVSENPFDRGYDFSQLREWFKPLREAEQK